MKDILIGFTVSFLIAFAAYIKKSLNLAGFISAIILGTILYFTDPIFCLIMLCFFVSSTVFTKYKSAFKENSERLHEKSGKRGFSQVAANGYGGLLFALLYFTTKNEMFMIAFVVTMASSNADTWASELGVLSKGNPVSIINFKPIEKGLSGGISLLGTCASLFGALFISGVFFLDYVYRYGFSYRAIVILAVCTLGGFLGSIIDSIMGATVQVKYFSKVTGELTEKRYTNGIKNKRVRGYKFINNDFVNFTSGIIAAAIIMFFYSLY